MDLDELERLLKAATAGPWISDDGIVSSDTREIHNEPPFVRGGACVMVTPVLRDRDADLIAALRNHAEELIRDARRWRFMLQNIHSLIAVMDEWENTVTLEWGCNYEHRLTAPTIPEAIDAAIAQEGKG